MNRLTADPIERIREFALAPAGKQSATVRQGIPSEEASFDSSRQSSGKGLRRRVAAAAFDADPGEPEMCRLARSYGFVVRIDGDARSEGRPYVKLFRFEDRSKPRATLDGFAEAMQWLAQDG